MIHRHGWPYDEKMPNCVEIAPTHCLRSTEYTDGRLAGFIIAHEAADLEVRCEGFLTVERPPNPSEAEAARPMWSMSGSLDAGDLTLSPSVLCTRDGDHGFVQGGKWVIA